MEAQAGSLKISEKFILTYGECADALSVSVATLKRWRQCGMPVVEIGERGVRMDPKDIVAWLKNHGAKNVPREK